MSSHCSCSKQDTIVVRYVVLGEEERQPEIAGREALDAYIKHKVRCCGRMADVVTAAVLMLMGQLHRQRYDWTISHVSYSMELPYAAHI